MNIIEIVSVSAITSALTAAAILGSISYLFERQLKKRKSDGKATY